MNGGKSEEPAKDGEFAGCSTDALELRLKQCLAELSARAVNDPDAAARLWDCAAIACQDLWQVCDRVPDVIRSFAAQRIHFPVTWPLLKEDQKEVFEKIKSLGVGSNAMYRIASGKQFNPNSRVNKEVMPRVLEILKIQLEHKQEFNRQYNVAELSGAPPAPTWEIYLRNRTNDIQDPWTKQVLLLPELSRQAADAWVDAIWEKIMIDHNGEPEKDPNLYEIGKHRRSHSEHTGQQKKATPRAAAANVRGGIKEGIHKAIRLIAGVRKIQPR